MDYFDIDEIEAFGDLIVTIIIANQAVTGNKSYRSSTCESYVWIFRKKKQYMKVK